MFSNSVVLNAMNILLTLSFANFSCSFIMPVPQGYGSHQGPSCLDKVKTGFLMGCCVGAASGILFGGFSALRFDLFFKL